MKHLLWPEKNMEPVREPMRVFELSPGKLYRLFSSDSWHQLSNPHHNQVYMFLRLDPNFSCAAQFLTGEQIELFDVFSWMFYQIEKEVEVK
jgi:hypothetical protein